MYSTHAKNMMGIGALWTLAAFMLLVSGCATHRPTGATTVSENHGGTGVDTGISDRGGDLSGRGLPNIPETTVFAPDGSMQTVHFDFDSSELRPDARAILEKNAALIAKGPAGYIQIAGHCDERGTQEYNLALGERRALAVREYLIRLGVSGDRLVTISYGEEAPEDAGHDESAWAQNRRGVFNKQVQ